MLTTDCLRELRTHWFPHVTDSGLDRLIELVEVGSPYLVAGCFSRATPMGCLATQIAWHHPQTHHLNHDAGVLWLTRVAGLNPATSAVIQEWDARGPQDWQLRADLVAAFRAERHRRASAEVEEPELQVA